MQILILIGNGALAAALTFAINWLALIPWRRARDQHWTERARLLYPVLCAANADLWIVPAILTMSAELFWPEESPHWMLMILATGMGAAAGTVPLNREAFPRSQHDKSVRAIVARWVIRFATWLIFLSAIALMPKAFNVWSLVIGAGVVALLFFWSRWGWLWTGRKLELIVPPPDRLQMIVERTAARMKVPVREFWMMRSSGSQAFAVPATQTLLFTDRMLAVLSDDELSAVCSHELAHLTEPKSIYYSRYVGWMAFLPWLFFKPLVHASGVFGYVILLCTSALAPRFYRDISRKSEVRADAAAKAAQPESGTYARALVRIYEDNLMPAVMARRGTHPQLYDRLLAAGVAPDFPRPLAANSTTWYARALALVMSFLAMALVIGYAGLAN